MNGELFHRKDDTDELLEHASLDVPREAWPQVLAELMDVMAAEFKREGLAPEAAAAQAEAAAVAIGHYLGGRSIYLPRGDKLQQAARDRRIWMLFRGNNTLELVDTFGLTERHVQRILAEQRAFHTRCIQSTLFDEES
jgi:Mor family transcriptional regulator